MPPEPRAEERIVAVASELMGREPDVDSWSLIRSGRRSIVLRGNGVVVKHALDHASGASIHEFEMLQFFEREFPGLAPAVVAVDEARRVIVLEDLGDGGSLADALIGDDSEAAIQAIDEFVDALARLHNVTAVVDPDAVPVSDWLTRLSSRASDRLSRRGATVLPPLEGAALIEARGLAGRLGSQSPGGVVSFGDMCPDNNVRTPSGLRFFDLETAARVNPAVDLAYLNVPFPSCWCSFDLPPAVRRGAVERYRSLVQNRTGVDDLHLAQAFFAVVSAGIIAPDLAADGDVESVVRGLALPTALTRLVHRLGRALDEPAIDEDLPALSSWMRSARSSLLRERHDVEALPLAPAFRAGTSRQRG